MELYQGKAQELIGSFLDREITLEECLAGLDSAFLNVDPQPVGEALDRLQSQARWNRRIVMDAYSRRHLKT